MDIKQLNKYCLERIWQYQNLNLFGKKVNTPYFINSVEQKFVDLMRTCGISQNKIREFHQRYKNREINYGWYMGKGTPEEICNAVNKICSENGIDLKGTKKEVIAEFMKLYGIGIDCSGFVYNVLDYAFGKLGSLEELKKRLAWQDIQKQTPSRAGVFIFKGSASSVISAKEARPLDLICISFQNYDHIGMLIDAADKLKVAQSTIGVLPTGVNLSSFSVSSRGIPVFGYQPDDTDNWEKLYKNGKLEFRRLKVLR
jgi:hypothetical protein